MGTMKCCSIFRGVVTLLLTSVETAGWRVLGFQGNPLTEDELERQREKVQKGPLLVRDREYLFPEDLISDEAGVIDPQLPVLTKVCCLVDGLKMGAATVSSRNCGRSLC